MSCVIYIVYALYTQIGIMPSIYIPAILLDHVIERCRSQINMNYERPINVIDSRYYTIMEYFCTACGNGKITDVPVDYIEVMREIRRIPGDFNHLISVLENLRS